MKAVSNVCSNGQPGVVSLAGAGVGSAGRAKHQGLEGGTGWWEKEELGRNLRPLRGDCVVSRALVKGESIASKIAAGDV